MPTEREKFEAFILKHTGRDMAYHERYETYGICKRHGEIAWEAWKAAVSQWRPIKTAPQDGTPVLLCDERTSDPDLANIRWAVWAGGLWRDGAVEARGRMVGLAPTHWMPLPISPAGLNEEIK